MVVLVNGLMILDGYKYLQLLTVISHPHRPLLRPLLLVVYVNGTACNAMMLIRHLKIQHYMVSYEHLIWVSFFLKNTRTEICLLCMEKRKYVTPISNPLLDYLLYENVEENRLVGTLPIELMYLKHLQRLDVSKFH